MFSSAVSRRSFEYKATINGWTSADFSIKVIEIILLIIYDIFILVWCL